MNPWEKYAVKNNESGPWDNYATGDMPSFSDVKGSVESKKVSIGNLFRNEVTNSLPAQAISGLLSGVGRTVSGVQFLGDKISGGSISDVVTGQSPESRLQSRNADLDRQLQGVGVDTDATLHKISRFGGELVGASPALKLLPAYAPMVAGSRAKALATNVASGAAAGTGMGAISDQGSAVAGGMVGAAVNTIIPPALHGLGKIAGPVWDAATRKYGHIQARKVIEDAAKGDLAAAKRLAEVSPEGLTAAQALAPLNNDIISALGKNAARLDETNYFQRLQVSQQTADQNLIGAVAGGSTREASIRAQRVSKDVLNAETAPFRDAARANVDVAAQGARDAQTFGNQAEALSNAAAQRVADAKRLNELTYGPKEGFTAKDLADNKFKTLSRDSQLPYLNLSSKNARSRDAHYQETAYPPRLVAVGERNLTRAADDSLTLGAASRDAQLRSELAAEYGKNAIRPIDIVPQIEAKAGAAGTRMNDLHSKVLTQVADDVQKAGVLGKGQIGFDDLYEIRKNSINNSIDKLLAGSDPSSKQKRASELLSQVRPLIDQAIEKAYPKWGEYLSRYEQGARNIDKQKLASDALSFLKKIPNDFEALVKGDKPDIVGNYFRGGETFKKAMGNDFNAFSKVAGNVERDRLITEGADRGQHAMQNIIDRHSVNFTLPNYLNREVSITNKVLRYLEKISGNDTSIALQNAMKSGKSFNEALQVVPASDRSKVLKYMKDFIPSQNVSGASANLFN